MVCYLILKLCQAVKLNDSQMTCVVQASSYVADYHRNTATSKSSARWETKYRF